MKNFSNEFVYRVLWIVTALLIILSEPINILRNCTKKNNIFGMKTNLYLVLFKGFNEF